MFSPPITGNIDLDAFLYDIYLGGAGGDVAPISAILSNSASAIGYKNKYIQIKYADDNIGTNLSNVPTDKYFFGINNVDSATESNTPADYTWFEVSEGFGSFKKFWYVSTGGRQLDYYIGTAGPTALYVYDTGGAIDLDVVTSVGNLSARVAYATSTLASLSLSPSVVTTIGNTSVPPINSWAGQETWSSTPDVGGIGTSLFRTDGLYNSTTSLTSWNAPYLSSIRVGSLSAISADLGIVNAGKINAGDTTNGIIIDADNKTIKVYNAGVLRVQIGDLTA
jgi:hypothetical protein